MKRLTQLLCAFAILSITLIGCGGEDDNGPALESTAEKVIGTTGGTVTTASNSVTITIPASALAADVLISVTPLATSAFTASIPAANMVLSAVTFGPSGTIFATPVTVTFTLPTTHSPGSILSLMLYDEVAKTWAPEGSATVSPDGMYATASISHFSTYVVLDANSITLQADVASDSFNFSSAKVTSSQTMPNADLRFIKDSPLHPPILNFISSTITEITTDGTQEDALSKYGALTQAPETTYTAQSPQGVINKVYVVSAPNLDTPLTTDMNYYKMMVIGINEMSSPALCTFSFEPLLAPPVPLNIAGNWTENGIWSLIITKTGSNTYTAIETDFSDMRSLSGTLNGLVYSGTWTALNGYSFDNGATSGAFTMTINPAGNTFSISYNEGGAIKTWSGTR